MKELFNPDSPVMRMITTVVTSVWLNILWIICCLPVFTIGASTTALYYVSMKMARNEEGAVTRQFFQSFKDNFRFSAKAWLILFALGIVLSVDGYALWRLHGVNAFWTILSAVFIVVLAVYAILLMYLFPLMARFENSLRNMFINALMIGMRYLLCTFLMAAIHFLMILVIVRIFTPIVIFGEGLVALLCSHLLLPIFDSLSRKEEE